MISDEVVKLAKYQDYYWWYFPIIITIIFLFMLCIKKYLSIYGFLLLSLF